MTFRKISLAFLIITMSAACAYAKKEPKYEQAHQLTPEQAALVVKAIAREKVLIKNIQQRTPLVETYIQDTKPDIKLYQVPIDDQYSLSRVDFAKGFVDKSYNETPRASAKKHGFFKGSFQAITGLTKALGLERFTYSPTGFMQMMFLDPTALTTQPTRSAMCAASSSAPCVPGSSTCIPRSPEWAASTAASGSRMRTEMSSASTAPTLARPQRTLQS